MQSCANDHITEAILHVSFYAYNTCTNTQTNKRLFIGPLAFNSLNWLTGDLFTNKYFQVKGAR